MASFPKKTPHILRQLLLVGILSGADQLMPQERPVPGLLREKQFYRRVGDDYEFSFLDPSPIWGGHTYFSSIVRSRGKWERWN